MTPDFLRPVTERGRTLNRTLPTRLARSVGNIALGILVMLSAVQCVQDFVSAPSNANPVVTITPDSGAGLAIGDDHPFVASLRLNNQDAGFRLSLRVISGAGTVDSLNRVRPAARGPLMVEATLSGPQFVNGSIVDTVEVAGVVPRIGLATQRTVDTLASLGEEMNLLAVALTNDGDTIPNVPFTWSESPSNGIASLQDIATGRVRALANGSTFFTVSVDGISEQRQVRVAQRAVTLRAAPDTVTMIAIGQQRTVTGTARDARGNAMATANVLWRSLDPSVATVTGGGDVVAVGAGRARVVALTPRPSPLDTLRDTVITDVAPARLVVRAGNAQSGVVGTNLAADFEVQLVDSTGADVADTVLVQFVVMSGSASFGGAGAFARLTDTSGHARARLMLGNTAGAVTVAVTGNGLIGPAAAFGATALPAAPASLHLVSGNNQSATVATATAAPMIGEVRDGFGNFVPNQTVVFAVTAGGGTFSGGRSSDTVITNAQGRAATTLTLGTIAGANTVSAQGPAGAALIFNATGNPGAPAELRYAAHPSDALAGSSLPFQVSVHDAYGNLVTGATTPVTVSLVAGSGTNGAVLSGATSVAAVAGRATFSDVRIDSVGTAYRVSAGATGLPPVSSNPFNVSAGTADHLAFTVQPALAAANQPIGPTIKVVVLDAVGNRVTSSNLLISLRPNAGGVTLFGTVVAQAVQGEAVFTDVRLRTAGTGYRLFAEASAIPNGSATSEAFSVVATAPATLSMVSGNNQNGVTGQALGLDFTVAVLDTFNNLVAGDTVDFLVTAGGGSIGSAGALATVSDAQGIGRARLTLGPSAGTNSVQARSRRVPTPLVFNASATPAGLELRYASQPTNTTGGSAITPFTISVTDAGGTIQNVSPFITLSVTSGTGTPGATVGGTFQVQAVNGTAQFTNVTVDKLGTGYTLTATATGVQSAVSSAFDVTVGAAARVRFKSGADVVSPRTAGASLGALVVEVVDAGGNVVPGANNQISLAIAAGSPAGATLSGTTTAIAANGEAAFPGLSIDRAGAGYTLIATSSGLQAGSSSVFTVNPGAAHRLEFTGNPSNQEAGLAITPAVTVGLRDQFGNAVSAGGIAVTLAITPSTGSASVTGGSAVTSGGVATFSAASIQRAGTGYTLTASSPGLVGDTSAAFNITPGAPAKLGFFAEPQNAAGGQSITPPIQVAVQDAFGNTVPTAPVTSVSLELVANTGSPNAVLSGGSAQNTSSGIAAFAAVSIDKAGTGYQLRANATGINSAVSAAFNISSSAAASLDIVSGNGQSGAVSAPLSQPFVVVVRDGLGNAVSGHTVWFVATGGGATFGGADSVAAVSNAGGEASAIMTLGPSDVPSTHTAEARAAGLAGSPRVFSASPVPVGANLAFSTQPANATAGQQMTVRVEVRSQSGVLIGNATSLVTLAVTSGTGTAGAQVVGTSSVNAVNGVATFSVGVDKVGTGYTLTATSSGLASTVSSAFNVSVGAASRLGFITQPSNTAFDATMSPAVQVAVQDAFGNTVTSSTAPVGLALSGGTGGAVLSGGAPVSAVNGIASFGALNVNLDGTGYALTAVSGGLINATSGTFNVFGSPVAAKFTTEPVNGTAGAALPAINVSIVDATGTVVTSASNNVTLAILTGPAGGALSGTATVTAANGVAAFSGLSLNRSGSYTLRATIAGLSSDTSVTFSIAAGGAASLAYSVEPASRSAGTPLAPFEVSVFDAQGNLITGVSNDVTIAIVTGTGAPGAILSGTLTRPSVGGKATFSDVTIDKAAAGYRLAASNGAGVAPDTSVGFNITVGPLATIVFTQSTSTLTSLGQQATFVAEGRDAQGNVVSGLTFAWNSSNTAAATVNGSGTVTAQANGSTTITATANGVSQQFVLSVAQVVNSVVITSAPVTLVSLNQTVALSAEARDANNNPIAGKVFTWASDAPAVSMTGNVAAAIANGSAGIRATTTGGVGGATVTSAPLTITVSQATASVVITPGTAVTLNAFGAGPSLSAQAFDALGSGIAGKTFAWTSTSGAITLGTANGISTTTNAAANGGAGVIAAVDGKADTVQFTVSQLVTSVDLSPLTVSLSSFNQTAQLTAVARDANGFAVAGPISFSGGNNFVAVNSAGLVTAVDNGSANITASSNGGAGGSTITSAASVVTVAQVVTSVEASPTTTTLTALGQTVAMTAVARDALGSAIAGKLFTWASNSPAVTVDQNTGVATAVAGGSAGITATTDGVTSPAATVTVAQVVADVILSGGGTTLSAFNQSTPAFVATARDANGFTIPGKTFTWSSDNAAVSVNASGVATAQANGSAGIRATTTGGPGGVDVSSAPSAVTVQQIVTSVDVTPGSITLAAFNATTQFTAVARDANGFAVAGKTFSWASDAAPVTIDPSTGVATAIANGSAGIRATTDGGAGGSNVVSAPATSTVSQVVTSVMLSGGGTLLTAFNQSTPAFVATALDANGFAVAGKTFTWSSDNAAVSVNASGVATAQANGSAGIRATTTSGSAAPDVSSAPSTVTVAQVVTAVDVTPGSATLVSFNETVQLTATARDANGFAVAGKTFAWAGGNGSVGLTNAGLATAVANGSASITATTDAVTSPAVTVTVAQLVASVVLSGGGTSLAAFNALTPAFGAEARDANGFAVAGKTFTWTSDAAAVVIDDPAVGIGRAAANGSAGIRATTSGGAGGSNVSSSPATVTVSQVTTTVVVTPGNATFGAWGGSGRTFSAEARDANGFAIAGKVFTWASTAPAVANVAGGAPSATRVVTAASDGGTTIQATVDAVTGTSTVTVAQVTASVSLTPAAPPSLASIGATQQFTATALDSNANPIAGKTFTWTSTSPGVASIPGGTAVTKTATAVANGSTNIIATVDGRADTSALAVQQIVTTVTVAPASATIGGAQSQLYSATARDAGGTLIAGITYTWQAIGNGNVTLNTAGPATSVTATRACNLFVVTCLSPATGQHTIRATIVASPAGSGVSGDGIAN